MRLNVCVLVLLLAVALVWAGPTPKAAQKKSLEDPKLESKKQELNIEETGEEKDRTKKSANFCVEIKQGSSQVTQVPCKTVQTPAQTVAQTAAQTAAQNTLLTIQSEPAAQTIQTLNVAQPSFVQSVPQSNIVLPRQILQPYQTFQIVQSALQPCSQPSPSVNIVQPISQSQVIQETSKPKPKPKPKPTPNTIQTTMEQPKPARIEQFSESLPIPQETLTVLPVSSSYQEPVITVPSSPMIIYPKPEPSQLASIIEIPSVSPCNNPLHGVLTPCTCQNNMAILSESSMEPMAIKVVSALPYSSPCARSSSSMVMPYNAHMVPHILAHDHMDKARHHVKYHAHIKSDLPYSSFLPQNNFQNVYEKTVPLAVETVPVNQYAAKNIILDHPHETPGITINAYPHVLRAANPMMGSRFLTNKETVENSPLMSGTNDFMQSNKAPREISANEFLPVKMEETKQEDERGDTKSYKATAN